MNRRHVPIYATGEHLCAYLPERMARTLFVDPREPLSPSLYDKLMEQGYRRSGEYIYKPHCTQCAACQSLRLPVARFRRSRRHRRCLQANSDVSVHAAPPRYDREHFDLYRRYVTARHHGSQMDDLSAEQYEDFLTASWCDSVFYEFRENGELLAVAVADLLPSSLSAVYTFYDPDQGRRSLGTLAILWLLAEARRLKRPYLYLGYWIEESDKMRYKSGFRPHQLHTGTDWVEVG